MGGGGKGGSQTTTTKVELPATLERGAEGVLSGALQAASLGYRPNRGVTIAGFSPQQMAAFSGANDAASAFGLPSAPQGQSPGGGYLPPTQTGAGGVQGYSTGALLDQNVAASMTEEDLQARAEVLAQFARDAAGVRAKGSGGPDIMQTPYYLSGDQVAQGGAGGQAAGASGGFGGK